MANLEQQPQTVQSVLARKTTLRSQVLGLLDADNTS